ncbi:type IV secretion system protein [Legionella feeleii]|uniref:Protein LvhB5 n=1 Tax=Legionella feeleii TaxID=453 RepID=A0A378IVP5_9GAMM|nr:type IV secretion system protein [Legionella feeleii]STX39297.1 protein LvhB5 [Legionella feeleii]
MKKLPKLVFAVLLVPAFVLHADLLNVQDIEMLKVAKDQLTNIKKVQDKLRNQLQELEAQKKVLEDSQAMMQGHYGYSSLYDKPSLTTWLHSGKDWSSLLNSREGASNDSLTSVAKQLSNEFPITPTERLYPDKNLSQAKLYDLLAKTTLASRASSTLAYNSIDEELAMLDALQREIEKSPNQKATLDLIARIQIEEAKLTAYKLKSDAVNSQLTSLQSQQEVSDAQWASNFFKWH